MVFGHERDTRAINTIKTILINPNPNRIRTLLGF